MHIITQSRIWEAKARFPTCESALDGWYRVIKKNSFNNFAELKQTFKSVDKVGDRFVFNIGGNKIRLIVKINFIYQKVFIINILNHGEYDRGCWKH